MTAPKPLIPCLVKMYELDGTEHQYTGLFKSTWDATQDAINRFGYGAAFARKLDQSREVQP